MGRYRKKPVEIEALQWDGTAVGATTVIDWILAGGQVARFHEATTSAEDGADVPAELQIDTLEGTMKASPGDFIIRGVKGEFYPCKADIFADTYEPVEDVSS